MRCWRGQFAQFAVRRVVLGRDVRDQCRQHHDSSARHPPASPRVLPGELRPAEHARAAEHAQDRRGQERVARVDRQPDRGERREHDHRHDARDRTQPRSHRQPPAATAPRPAPRPASTGGRRISPIRRGMYSGTLAIPVTRSSTSGGVPGVRQRPQRVAGDRQSLSTHTSGAPSASRVRPRELAGASGVQFRTRDLSRVKRALSPLSCMPTGREAEQIQPVQPGEHPRLRAQQPGERQQREHRPARPGSAGLHEQRAEHEQQVGNVDVRAHAVGEHRHARDQQQCRQRAGGPPEPACGQRVDHPGARRQRQERQRDGHVQDRPRDRAARARRRGSRPADGAWERSGPRRRASSRARAVRPRRARTGCRS